MGEVPLYLIWSGSECHDTSVDSLKPSKQIYGGSIITLRTQAGHPLYKCYGRNRGSSPIQNSAPLEPYSRNMPRALGGS